MMLPIYYDAEFTGLHKDTSLISIGLVSHNGSYFYAEFNDYYVDQINNWLKENVIDNLLFKDKEKHFERSSLRRPSRDVSLKTVVYDITMKDSRENIKQVLYKWLLNEQKSNDSDEQIQIYTDCYAYDWVLFNDLLCKDGEALNLPEFINYIPIDLSTLMFTKGVDPDITREEFIYNSDINYVKSRPIFENHKGNIKHNSLWDAYIAKYCFAKLFRK